MSVIETKEEKGRLTETMPLSLQSKLFIPEEVTILNENEPIHALIYKPAREGKLQPLLWLHGGSMA